MVRSRPMSTPIPKAYAISIKSCCSIFSFFSDQDVSCQSSGGVLLQTSIQSRMLRAMLVQPCGAVLLLSVRHFTDRVFHPRSRALDVFHLRHRMATLCKQPTLGRTEQELGLRLRRRREEISARLASVKSCSSCAKGAPEPNGRWDGGFCCGGNTEDLFDDDQLAALMAGGTRNRCLTLPRCAHAGCAFRGPTGCSLPAGDRPTRCVAYICDELWRELAKRKLMEPIERLVDDLLTDFKRFQTLRSQRLEQQWLRELGKELG